MLMVRHEIFPYVGSYKAIINAINYFGYNDLELYEYYRNINTNSPDFFKLFKVEIPDIFDNTVEGWTVNDFIKHTMPNPNFEDTNLFNLTYKITDKEGNNVLMYSLAEVIMKLQGLKYWLQKNVIPITHRILDITGRADFVGINTISHRNYDTKIINMRQTMTPVDFHLNEAYLMPVNSSSTVYTCHIDFMTATSSAPDYFTIKIRTYKTYKEWNPFTTYTIDDRVTYYGKVYESVIVNNKINIQIFFFTNSQQKKLFLITHFLNETGVVYLQRLWYSGNNMFGFHECELAIQKYKNIKTDTLCVTLDNTKN
jgi:hypothetical protein